MALPAPFDEAAKVSGYYRTAVGAEIRYVTRDGGRAVIGPLSHRKRHKGKKGAPPAYTGSRLMKPEDVAAMQANLSKAFSNLEKNFHGITLRDEVPPAPEPAKPRRKRLRVRPFFTRVRATVEDWFWIREWHEAVRHIAIDLLVWVLCLSVAAIMIKCAWWVVSA